MASAKGQLSRVFRLKGRPRRLRKEQIALKRWRRSILFIWFVSSAFALVSGFDDLFARLGSVLVGLTLIIAYLDGRDASVESSRLHQREIDRIVESINVAAIEGVGGAQRPADNERKAFDTDRRSALRWELGALFIGTIQWGFGDLLVKSVHRMGVVP